MRAYRLLLRLYPVSFRNEYGRQMTEIFERRLRDADGAPARAVLWFSSIAEAIGNAMLVHLDLLRQDVRYVARTLKRTPGFAATAVAIVALGIGATTAAFSVTDFVLIRPLPFPEPSRLLKVWETTPGYSRMELSAPNYRDIKAAATSFEAMGTYHFESLTFTSGNEPRRFEGSSVSADLLPTLGVAPLLGRTFTPQDDSDGAPGTLVLSYRLWQMEFGGDPKVVGRSVPARLDTGESRYTIIGVMPRQFHFPDADALFWVTNRFGKDAYTDAERSNNWLEAVGRLRPGATLSQARAQVAQIGTRLRQQYPKENEGTSATVIALGDEVSQRARLLLLALSGAAACVLLIACANLANLLLARAVARRRELAVRAAMGAGRERLVRQLLTESVMLATIGGALGVGVAVAAVPLLTRLVPHTLPIAASPTVDVRVLLFAVALSALTGTVFGLAPVVRLGRNADLQGLRDGARAGGGRKGRLRSALVAAEIAASIVLLVCAGLLLRSLVTIQGTDPGFKPDGVLTLRTELPMPEYGRVTTRQAYYARVLQEVRALPGVRSAGFASFLPMSSFRGGIWPVSVKGDADAGADVRSANNVASIRYVTPGFFSAMGIPLERGRDVSDSDSQARPYVAVVSQSFARRYWPHDDPIGRHFAFAFADREVVGVVGDVRFRGLERVSEPQVYLSSAQVDDGSITFYTPKALAIRAGGPPASLAPAVRAIVRHVDPALPITEMQTLTDLVALDTASRSAQLRVVGAFALIACALAAVGIHGLLSFAVAQRTQEIGVRMALGAQPRDVLAMVAAEVVRLGAAGVAIGLAVAYAAGRSMEAILAGVKPDDGATFGTAVGLAVVMLVIGTAVPVLRALRVDPITAVRAE
jgi:predicted permease